MGARGEQVIRMGDQEIRILFTNRALAEAEQTIGKSIVSVAQALVAGSVGIGDIAQLLRVGMQEARRDAGERPIGVQMDKAYKVLDEVGFTAVATAVMEAVSAVLGYGVNQEEDTSPNGKTAQSQN